ncbi:hypothetical protein H4R20_000821 [Coemansia guatemalensis]|uniref:Uncharacterized protein n=1 Tax=Coemansia guatemalensis TaxID=2761395 RepID=A0A9W8HY78_9FUNG|nr:hypothetical protein H4R20_000821 [Coemansia guatemalensis]
MCALDHIDYLFAKLLNDFVVADRIFKPNQLVDQPANAVVGSGFLKHNEVKIGGLGAQLYGNLLKRNTFSMDAHTGTDADMDGVKTQLWTYQAAELLDHILFAVHIGRRQPAHAPELACLLYNNLPSLFHSLHIIKGKSTVCLSNCYWKGQVPQQYNKQVLQFLDVHLSGMLFMYLAIIQPVEVIISTSKIGCKTSSIVSMLLVLSMAHLYFSIHLVDDANRYTICKCTPLEFTLVLILHQC